VQQVTQVRRLWRTSSRPPKIRGQRVSWKMYLFSRAQDIWDTGLDACSWPPLAEFWDWASARGFR
jgi:hypothetical protein